MTWKVSCTLIGGVSASRALGDLRADTSKSPPDELFVQFATCLKRRDVNRGQHWVQMQKKIRLRLPPGLGVPLKKFLMAIQAH